MNLNQQVIHQLLSLIDLTSLNETDTNATVADLCRKATQKEGRVAAVCIFPAFVEQAKGYLKNTHIKLATVANFPKGTDPLDKTLHSIRQSITHGANEIDVVFPYVDFLNGNRQSAAMYIQACKKECGPTVVLKVILETGAIQHPHLIKEAAQEVFVAGADFIKTSTGKIAVGATLAAAEAMLMVVRELTVKLKRPLGFKVSGGIRTPEVAWEYVLLAEAIMGKEWIQPAVFRIGASQLVDVLTTALQTI